MGIQRCVWAVIAVLFSFPVEYYVNQSRFVCGNAIEIAPRSELQPELLIQLKRLRFGNETVKIFPTQSKPPQVHSLTQPGALWMALNLRQLALLPGDRLVIRDGDGTERIRADSTNASRLEPKDTASIHMWDHPVLMLGNQVTIEYYPSLMTLMLPICRPQRDNAVAILDSYFFAIERSGHVHSDSIKNSKNGCEAEQQPNDELESTIGGTNDLKEAVCYKKRAPQMYAKAKPVVRLLIRKQERTQDIASELITHRAWYFCSGWLVGKENHLLTNYHCIFNALGNQQQQMQSMWSMKTVLTAPSSEEQSMATADVNFMAETKTCKEVGVKGEKRGIVESTKAHVLAANQTLDYCLLRLVPTKGTDLSDKYGYLTLRASGPVDKEPIYIPQHPNGEPKEIASTKNGKPAIIRVPPMTVNGPFSTSAALTDSGYVGQETVDPTVFYNADTMPGSSGSPVLSQVDNNVIALHHAGIVSSSFFSSDAGDVNSTMSHMNAGIRIDAIVQDMQRRRVLPPCALSVKCARVKAKARRSASDSQCCSRSRNLPKLSQRLQLLNATAEKAMRERRHLSGNSNANNARPASAAVCSVTGRSSPENGSIGSPKGKSTLWGNMPEAPRVRRSGAATARRPTTASATDNESGGRRRVQSARGESSSQRVSGPALALAALPRLSTPTQEAYSGNNAPGRPTLTHRDNDQVQWAISVGTTNSGDAELPTMEPMHLKNEVHEFCELLRERYDGKRSMRQTFRNWDRDRDGKLSVQEVSDMMHVLGFTDRLGSAKVDAILAHISTSSDSCLRYDAFCVFVNGGQTADQNAGKTSPFHYEPPRPRGSAVKLPMDDQTQSLYTDPAQVLNLLRKKYELRQISKVFRDWDAEKRGYITINEFDRVLRRQGVVLANNQLQELFDQFDSDHDGKIMHNEFIPLVFGTVDTEHSNPALHARRKRQQQVKLQDTSLAFRNQKLDNPMEFGHSESVREAVQRKLDAFSTRMNDAYAAFDDDHSGNLSYLEFRHGLQELGLHLKENEFIHLARAVDTDGSGEISFQEFKQFLHPPGRKSTINGADERNHETKTAAKKNSGSKNRGTFDFTHLSRRIKIPTRMGRTPVHDTSDLIRGDCPTAANHFQTESQLYGGAGCTKTTDLAPKGGTTGSLGNATTMGQQEKQMKEASYEIRLNRMRQQEEQYLRNTDQQRIEKEILAQRRVQTVHRQQLHFQQTINASRPRYVQESSKARAPSHVIT